MKHTLTALFTLFFAVCAQAQPMQQTTPAQPANPPISPQIQPQARPLYTLDVSRSVLQFYVNARLTNVKGLFRQMTLADVTQTGDLSTLRGKLLVDTASVFTREKKRDDHLKADDFFWSEKYPNAIVTLKNVAPAGQKDLYNCTISLRIRDKEKDFVVPTTIVNTPEGVTANGQFIVDRTYYDLNGEYMANKIMSDDAEITFRLVLVKNR